MSHGHGGNDVEIAQPNLTPLLDMVLQLVMFFVLCTNFVMEQLDPSVKLPRASSAKSLDRSERSVLFLNVNNQGHLLPQDGDRQPIRDPRDINQYLVRKFKYRESTSTKDDAEKMLVIIRADQDAKMEMVHNIMKACKGAGFARLQLRVMRE